MEGWPIGYILNAVDELNSGVSDFFPFDILRISCNRRTLAWKQNQRCGSVGPFGSAWDRLNIAEHSLMLTSNALIAAWLFFNKVRAVMRKQQISFYALLKGNQRIAAVKYSPLVQEGRPLRLFRGDLFHPMRKQIHCSHYYGSFFHITSKNFRTFKFGTFNFGRHLSSLHKNFGQFAEKRLKQINAKSTHDCHRPHISNFLYFSLTFPWSKQNFPD